MTPSAKSFRSTTFRINRHSHIRTCWDVLREGKLMHEIEEVEKPVLRAVEYVRMSTEHQQYSTEKQSHKIREDAAKRGIEIVRTYADAGKSGLRLDGRVSLQKLLQEVESGNADFSIILVYDVSRWGRFQDADESA